MNGRNAAIFLGACVVVSALLVRAVRDVANRRALLDRPNERSSHSIPKPRVGGVGVVAALVAVGASLVAAGRAAPALLVPLGATFLVALLGLADDLRPLPARVRFGVQLALASVVVAAAWGRLPAVAGTLGAWLPAPVLAVLAVLWIVWLTNLYNFMDGIDGLAGGQAVIAALGLAIVASEVGATTTQWLLLAVAGSSLGFLIFNFPPASIFMGDVGSTALGFFFGCVPLLGDRHPVPVGAVAVALALFALDATVTLVCRVARGERWYAPHRTHLYQRPVARGVSHRKVTLIAYGGMVLVAICASRWERASPPARLFLAMVPALLFLAGHAAVRHLERRHAQAPTWRPEVEGRDQPM
jgi:Fuc2NAc and GlcNAc transferase